MSKELVTPQIARVQGIAVGMSLGVALVGACFLLGGWLGAILATAVAVLAVICMAGTTRR